MKMAKWKKRLRRLKCLVGRHQWQVVLLRRTIGGGQVVHVECIHCRKLRRVNR